MSTDLPAADIEIAGQILSLFDDSHYSKLAMALRDEFQVARPYPHVVIDNFLPPHLAAVVSAAYPDPSDADIPWKTHENGNVSRKFIEDVKFFPMIMRLFAESMMARQFLLFLETLSGIDCLVPDPYFLGGGAMVSGRGDFLNVHADFNWHHKLQAHRRLNALLYLTPNWDPTWGGDLELWSSDFGRVERIVAPAFNRLVVFAVSDEAVHGQPVPLTSPMGVFRRVFSAFYYTTRRDNSEWNDPHFTMYKPENSPYGMNLLDHYQREDDSTS